MKKILLSFFSVVTFGAFAQADVSARLASPAANATITAGTQFNFDVVIKNEGTEPVDMQDTLFYLPVINGSYLGNGQGGIVGWGIFTTINPGDSITESRQLNISGGSSGNLTFCAEVIVVGAGWTGVTETDTVNNIGCNPISYNAGGGVSISEISLVNSMDNSYYNNGTFFVRMANYSFDNRAEMKVYNTMGAEVFSSELAPNGSSLVQDVDLSQLDNGIYIVKVAGGNNAAVTHKIMVK